MYGCETWTVKKAECRKIDVFELWCCRRVLRVPWTARRSVLGIHWKDWCWSWNSNTLATWCEELTHWKRPWCWEGLGAGGEGDDRGWDGWMALPTRWAWVWVNSGSLWRQGGLACCDSWGHKESDKTEQLNWTEGNNRMSSELRMEKGGFGPKNIHWGGSDRPRIEEMREFPAVPPWGWLRLSTSTAWPEGWIPGWGTNNPHDSREKKKKSRDEICN